MTNETPSAENIDQEQIDELKENIIKQIKENSNFSQEQKEQFIQKIKSLDNEGFIQFLKKQGIIKDESSGSKDEDASGSENKEGSSSQPESQRGEGGQKCIFCSIVFGDAPSWKIAENKKAIAVLEINPLSKGHILVIPKEHVSTKEKIPEEAKVLAAEVSEKIKKELQPQDIRFQGKNIFGHEILNIIPLYEDQKLEELKQKQASKEELQELNNSLQFSTEEEEQKEDNKEESYEDEGPSESQEEINEKNTWLPRRIP